MARAARVGVGGAVALLLLALLGGTAAGAQAGAPAGPTLRGTGVRGFDGTEPSNAFAEGSPAAVNVVGLTVSAGIARVQLVGPYEGLGPAHVVAVVLSAPGAPPRRLVLAGDGRASDEIVTDGRYVAQGPATVSVEGAVVAFTLPPEAAPDWTIQGEAWLPDQGFHSRTAFAPLGALTGALPPLAVAGVPAGADGPAWYLPARPLPDAVRPVGVAVEERGGRPAVVVEMAAPPQAVTELAGEPVTSQSVTVVLGGALHQGAERIVADPAAATSSVSVEGSTLIFPFAYRDAVPAAPPPGLPTDAPARPGTAVATPVTCGSPESFVVEVALAGGQLVLTHFDGDVARGPVDAATGAGTLTSPDGREYVVESVVGATITVPELRYNDCVHRVTLTLDAPFALEGPPRPVAITDATPVHVESRLLTASGGVVAVGPEVPLLALVVATGAPPTQPAPSPEPSDAASEAAAEPTETATPAAGTAIAELVPYGAGAAAFLTLLIAGILLLRRPRAGAEPRTREHAGSR